MKIFPRYRLITVFWATAFVALSITVIRWLNPATTLPKSWLVTDITAAAVDSNDTILDSDILVWRTNLDGDPDKDAQPFVKQSCIAWIRFIDRGGVTKFRLAYISRLPGMNNSWYSDWANDADFQSEVDFHTPPTSQDILDFIKKCDWDWRLSYGQERTLEWSMESFRKQFLDGRICFRAWKRRTGQSFDADVPFEYFVGGKKEKKRGRSSLIERRR